MHKKFFRNLLFITPDDPLKGMCFGNFFLLSKQKVVYLLPFSCSLPFFKFQKQNFMYFGHKHVETRPSYPHGMATFLKYYMPLKRFDRG